MKKLMPKPMGFTIIEVIIVLVVGAVIMLAVFLVVPQLQQSARNNQRRNDIQRVLVAARQYYSSNQFRDFASESGGIDGNNIKALVVSDFKDPNLTDGQSATRNYQLKPRSPADNSVTGRTGVVTWIEIFNNRKCRANQMNSSGVNDLVASDGSIAVTLDIEPINPTMSNGFYYGKSYYCISD